MENNSEKNQLAISDYDKEKYLDDIVEEANDYKKENPDKLFSIGTNKFTRITSYISNLFSTGKLRKNVSKSELYNILDGQEYVIRGNLLGISQREKGELNKSVQLSMKNRLVSAFKKFLPNSDDKEIMVMVDNLYRGNGEDYSINLLDEKIPSEYIEKIETIINNANNKRTELGNEFLKEQNNILNKKMNRNKMDNLIMTEDALDDVDRFLITPINLKRAKEEIEKSRGFFARFRKEDKNIKLLAQKAKDNFKPYNPILSKVYRRYVKRKELEISEVPEEKNIEEQEQAKVEEIKPIDFNNFFDDLMSKVNVTDFGEMSDEDKVLGNYIESVNKKYEEEKKKTHN